MGSGLTRRQAVALGLGGVSVLAAGGVVWRAWDNGVFSVGRGPAYQPWHSWRDDALGGPMAMVQAAILAANAHNTQPWRFRVGEERLELYADHDRHLGSFDPFRREMYLSFGCALENLAHAARAQGREPSIKAASGELTLAGPPDPAAPTAVVELAPAEAAATELFQAIAWRHTHRGAYLAERTVPGSLLEESQALVPEQPAMRLFLFQGGGGKDRLAGLIVAATEAIITDSEMAADSARWFRFAWDAVQRHRDGVTLDSVGLPPLISAVAKVLPAPSAEEADRMWLDGTREVHVASAPLLGMIAVRDLYDIPTALAAGRLWQRIHLWATARGLVAQPLNQPVEVVDRERELDAPPHTAEALAELTGDPAWHPTFVFRMGYADRPARLSPRRPLQAVVTN